MGNNIDFDREKYKLAFAFLEQGIQQKCDEADQYVEEWEQGCWDKSQELDRLYGEMAKLQARQGQVPLLARMFRFGGEEFDEAKVKAELAGRIERNRERAASCDKRLNELKAAAGERERNEQFLMDAACLRGQDELFLRGEPVNLSDWSNQKKESIIQAKYAVLRLAVSKTPSSGLCDLLWNYLSEQKFKDIPMTDEKGAFCAVCAYQFLKQALAGYCANAKRDSVDRAVGRIGQTLAGVKAGISPYQAVEQYRLLLALENLEGGKAGIEEIAVLGMRYNCYPDGTGCCKTGEQRLEIHLRAWRSCFEKALEDEDYHKLMQESIKAGVYEFLTVYDNQGEKRLNNVFAEWKNRERFADYAVFFKEEMERYLQKKEEQARREEQAKKAEKERKKEQKKERIAARFRKAPAGSEGVDDRGALVHMLMLFSAMIAATGNIYLFAGAWLLLLFVGRKAKSGWKADIQLILVFLISMAAYHFTGGYSLASALFVTKEAGSAALSKSMLVLFAIPVIARHL